MPLKPLIHSLTPALLALAILSCGGGGGSKKDDPPPPAANVYVVGYERNTQGVSVATLWVNGKSQRLGSGNYASTANSVFVFGNDVYAVGAEYISQNYYNAKLWINGNAVTLNTRDNSNSEANSVFVANDKIYVSGRESGHSALWELNRNGTNQIFNSLEKSNSGIYSSFASSVFVDNNDVYIAGYQYSVYDGYIPTLWASNFGYLPQTSWGGPGWANSIFVQNGYTNVVGAKGRESTEATIWQNDMGYGDSLSRLDSVAGSVFVKGNNTYIVGYERSNSSNDNQVATLWTKQRTTQTTRLSNGTSSARAYSVYVSGMDEFGNDKVYIAGGEYNAQGYSVATLWINGNVQRLSSDNIHAIALSVFVK